MNSRGYGFFGPYGSWEEARADSAGYEAEAIIDKVRVSLLKVKNGEAMHERDSVLFDKIHYSWPLLSSLMYAAARSRGEFRVLDFGGSLGSSYYQNRKFLGSFEDLSWSVVEQERFVRIGKDEFEDDRLKFYKDIKSCVDEQNPNVLLLSSVLQYIEDPYRLIDELVSYNFEYIIMDRTIFGFGKDEVMLQKVSPSIYDASYPCWFLDKKRVFETFAKQYTIIESFESTIDGRGANYEVLGFVAEKR
ncbi:MAG: methyltransferase, TIGR04325 family [Sulfuricurvum sp.]|jgi:putative methyltransferase (TIGR04325 family)